MAEPEPTDLHAARPVWRRLAVGASLLLVLGAGFLCGGLFTGERILSGAFEGLRDLLSVEHSTTVRPQANVVVAVRELARLETTTYHIERVIDLADEQSRFGGLLKQKDAILLVAAADVTAGVDLARLRDDDVRTDEATRTVRITLPQPEVLSTVLDNERTYVHSRATDVLAKRQEDLEQRARQAAEAALRDAALDAGILDRARDGAARALETLLRATGWEQVEIRWR